MKARTGYFGGIEVPAALCYVDGCYTPVCVTVRHKRFGLVVSCADHNPIQFGQVVPIVKPRQVEGEAAAVAAVDTSPRATLAATLAGLSDQQIALIASEVGRAFGASDDSADGDGRAKVPVRPIPPAPGPAVGALPPAELARKRLANMF